MIASCMKSPATVRTTVAGPSSPVFTGTGIGKPFRILLRALLISLCFCSIAAAQGSENKLILLTEEYPPLNYKEDGRLKGLSVDLMVRMLELAGMQQSRDDIRLVPWSNGYNQVLVRENTVLFAMSRTASREELFKWVGPITTIRIALIGKKDKQIEIDQIEGADRYRIGVIRDDSGENLLLQADVDPSALERLTKPVSMIRMIEAGRIDVVAYGDISWSWILKQNGYRPADYEVKYVLDQVPAYYAFNINTPDEIVREFQKALEELKQSGEYQQIMDKYLQ